MSSSLAASKTLCQTAMEICLACIDVPVAPFCALAINDGNGDAGQVEDAAQAWRATGQRLGRAKDELASLVNSIPVSEWQSTDRELYQQQASEYLRQLGTSATAAQAAGDMLSVAAAAIFTFATFAMSVAAVLSADAAAVGFADATIIGAPEGEAEATVAGAACLEALEAANAVLQGALATVAAALTVGVAVDTGLQLIQGDTAAIGDFTQAVVHGLGADLRALPQEITDHVQDKVVGSLREEAMPEGEPGGASGES